MIVLPAAVGRTRKRRRAPDGLGPKAACGLHAAFGDAQLEFRPVVGVPEHGDQARLVLDQRLRPSDRELPGLAQDRIQVAELFDGHPERLHEQVQTS